MSRHRRALSCILLAQFVIPLSISGTAVALPSIADDLGAASGPLQWVVNGFNVSFALCTILWGVLSDRMGYTRSFQLGIALAVLGGVISAAATDVLMLDVGRVVAGVGSAAVLTGATPLLSTLFEGAERARAFALFGTVNGLGLAAGPAMSGFLQSTWGWRGIFAAHVVVLLVVASGTMHLPGIARGRTSLGELLDFSSLKVPRFLAMVLVPVAAGVGFVSFLTYLPSALSAVHGMPSASTGAFMLVMTLPLLAAPTVVHRALAGSRITTSHVAKVSFLCLVVGVTGALLLVRPELPVALTAVPMVFLGLGFGLPLGFVDAEALSAVPDDRVGAASGVINLFRVGSEAVFVALFAAVVSVVVTGRIPGDTGESVAAGAPGHADVYRAGFATAAAVMLVLLVLLSLAFVLLDRRGRKNVGRQWA